MSDRRIVVLPADATACGSYRLVWPAEHLRHLGHDVVVNPWRQPHPVAINVVNRPPLRPGSPAIVHDVQPVDADMVVFQRPNTARLHTIITKIQSQGVRVCVEVDDALWQLDRSNAAWPNYNGDPQHGPHWKWLLRCLRQADVATVSTPALADKIGGGNVRVIPNFIRGDHCDIGAERLSDGPWDGMATVGWGAHLATHPHDPDVTRGRVADAVRSSGAFFLSVGGTVTRECAAFGFDEDDHGEVCNATGGIPMPDWMKALSQLDVSVVPLADNAFNQSKSALKMLESAAVGAAVLASPTPDNRRVAGDGVGRIISSPKDWERVTANLCKDPVARHEMAVAGHEAVRERHTIEDNSWRWLEAWESAWTR